jgi:outer membrane protein assembly factor BamB
MMPYRAAAILLFLASCGDKSKPASGGTPAASGDAGATHGAPPAARPGVTVTAAWSWGDQPKGEHGPRMRDPNEPLPTGPAFIAAGKGKLVVATQDSCLELLDGKTGKEVVPHRCEKDAWAFGLAVLGDVAIVARQNGVTAYSLADLKEVWKRMNGFVQNNQPLARPSVVDGHFCVILTVPNAGSAIECLDPATGKPGKPWAIPAVSRVAFGERRIGIIPNVPVQPPAGGVELPVELYSVDGKRTSSSKLAGSYGPTFERSRPLFVARGGGNQKDGWITRFLDPDGNVILTVQGKEMLRGGAAIGKDILTSQFGAAGSKDRAVLLRSPDGATVWGSDLGVSGPWDPFALASGKTAFMTQGGKLFALDATTGAITKSFDLESDHQGVWQDKVLFLISARESRSDSDFGDAAVYAVDVASLEVVLRDELGKDVPGGQQASDPVFDGDMAFAIAGGRVHAYRVTVAP